MMSWKHLRILVLKDKAIFLYIYTNVFSAPDMLNITGTHFTLKADCTLGAQRTGHQSAARGPWSGRRGL